MLSQETVSKCDSKEFVYFYAEGDKEGYLVPPWIETYLKFGVVELSFIKMYAHILTVVSL